MREPLDVTVLGRPGVGCRTVIRALRCAGMRVSRGAGMRVSRGAGMRVSRGAEVAPDGHDPLNVYVFSEALKPEDLSVLNQSPRPQLVIFNKADLVGFGTAPIESARQRCRELQKQLRLPVEPLSSLLSVASAADAVLDEPAWAALEVLVTKPADLGSVDGFVTRSHSLPRRIREQLLADLDLYGIGCAVATLRCGGDRKSVRSALRQASGIDDVLAALEAASAPVRYRRLATALRCADAPHSDVQWAATDEVVLARMDAAAQVLAAAGMAPETVYDAAGYLHRAIVWDRNSRGFISPLYRACSVDMVRGSLRLLSRCER